MRITFGICLANFLIVSPIISADERTQKQSSSSPVVGQTWTVPSVGIRMLPVAAGSFKMGSGEAKEWEADQKPVHRVTISRPFWMAEHETTIQEYLFFLRKSDTQESGLDFENAECPVKRTEDGYALAGGRFGRSERQPITHVSWYGAKRFCEWLTEQESSSGNIPQGYTFRLPTEAEWEYACRAGTTDEYVGDPDSTAWYHENSDNRTHEVATKAPNPWGLYDMIGNCSEWCFDWYGPYPSKHVTDPVPPKQDPEFKVLRGCAFPHFRYACRVATRFKAPPDKAGGGWGFRIVLAPDL